MTTYSRDAQESLLSTEGQTHICLLEINHPDLTQPIRVALDRSDVTSNSQTYVALAARIEPPDDFGSQSPKATIAIDNVGRELMTWLEASGGGRGATCTLRNVMRDTPDTVEYECTLNLTNLSANWIEVQGQLGYENLLNKPAVQHQYRQDNSPGLWS